MTPGWIRLHEPRRTGISFEFTMLEHSVQVASILSVAEPVAGEPCGSVVISTGSRVLRVWQKPHEVMDLIELSRGSRPGEAGGR